MEIEHEHEVIKYIEYFDERNWEGYRIKLIGKTIEVRISNEPQCCELWGVIASSDDLNNVYGWHLYSIDVVKDLGKDNKNILISNIPQKDGEETEVCFVNLNTNHGIIQFALYNSHNGFYGHDVCISSYKEEISFEDNI